MTMTTQTSVYKIDEALAAFNEVMLVGSLSSSDSLSINGVEDTCR